MLLIMVVATISTISFFRRAKLVGIHPGRSASIPLFAAGLMIAATYTSALVFGRILATAGVSENTARWLGFAMEWFLVFAYLFYIKRNWDAMTAISPVVNQAKSDATTTDKSI